MYSIAIHGGGVWANAMRGSESEYLASLKSITAVGKQMIGANARAVDIAEALTVLLEDDPLYKAGRGSVSEIGQKVTMDAAIHDGQTHTYGSVTTLRNVRNPIKLARYVMNHRTESMIVGPGAEAIAREIGLELESDEYFCVAPRPGPAPMGTVGAVVKDKTGNLAAATSTGGFPGHKVSEWRVGDSPIVGGGTLADNRSCALSACGHGERMVGAGVVRRIAARIELLKEEPQAAIEAVLEDWSGDYADATLGGIIGVDTRGRIGMGVAGEFCMAVAWVENDSEIKAELKK